MALDETGKTDGGRRWFLGAAGGAGALGAFAILFGKGIASAPALPQVPLAEPEPEPSGRGYRETEHVRQYYRSARYW